MSSPSRRFNPELNEDGWTRLRAEHKILCSLAGPAAETQFTGRENHVGAGCDHHQAVDLASYLIREQKELEAYLAYLYLKAENILKVPEHWAMVEALAKALLEKETLSSREAHKIMRGAWSNFFGGEITIDDQGRIVVP